METPNYFDPHRTDRYREFDALFKNAKKGYIAAAFEKMAKGEMSQSEVQEYVADDAKMLREFYYSREYEFTGDEKEIFAEWFYSRDDDL